MCQGFSDYQFYLHHFVLAKLATSIIGVKNVPYDLCWPSVWHPRWVIVTSRRLAAVAKVAILVNSKTVRGHVIGHVESRESHTNICLSAF